MQTLEILALESPNFTSTSVFIIVVCATVAVIILCSLAFFYIRRRRRLAINKDEDSADFPSMFADSLPVALSSREGGGTALKVMEADVKPVIPLTLHEEVSAGLFGVVWKASHGDQIVAAKKIYVDLPKDQRFQILRMFIQEAKLMMILKHPRIVEFIDFDQEKMAIIMEYMPMGSLHSHILEKKNLSWTDRIQVIRDITEGMVYLHAKEFNGKVKKDVFHQDFKSANVLLKEEDGILRAKISDFGLSSL